MRDVHDFNLNYLHAVRTAAFNAGQAAMDLNIGLSQISELVSADQTFIHSITGSTILIVEPNLTIHDIGRSCRTFASNQQVVDLNFEYLSLVRHLANKGVRIASMSANMEIDLVESIKRKSLRQLRIIAESNKLLCKFSMPLRVLKKASKSTISNKQSLPYLGHLNLLSRTELRAM